MIVTLKEDAAFHEKAASFLQFTRSGGWIRIRKRESGTDGPLLQAVVFGGTLSAIGRMPGLADIRGAPMNDITRILAEVNEGDDRAADRLLSAVYNELRRLAARKLSGERPGHTLQGTALVHEAYLRLLGGKAGQWENSSHFFGAAAEAMRRILVESARRKARLKHGGGRRRRQVDEADAITVSDPTDMVALNDALEKLACEDKVKADLVNLRYFAGLTVEQAAQVLGISRSTADRYWTFARTWLYNEMNDGSGQE